MQKMENLHVYKDYHDIRINGIYHDKSQNILKLLCDNSQEIIFSNILQFEFNFFSDKMLYLKSIVIKQINCQFP